MDVTGKKTPKKRSKKSSKVVSENNITEEPVIESVVVQTEEPQSIAEANKKFFQFDKKRALLNVGLGVLSGLIITAGLLLWLSRYSFIRANIAGIGVHNNVTQELLKNQISQKAESYKITIDGSKGTTSYSLADAGLSIDADASATQALDTKMPKNILNRAAFWKSTTVPLVIKTDQVKFDTFLQTHMIEVITPTKNAGMGIDNGHVVTSPEQVGQVYATPNDKVSVLANVSKLASAPLKLQVQNANPAITLADIQPVKQKVEAMLAQKINFTIDGDTITVKPGDIGSWFEITPVDAEKTIDANINSGKVLEYLNRIAKPYVQPPRSAIVMPDGTVLVAGKSGIDIENKENVASDVAKKVVDAKGMDVDLPVKYAAYKTVTATPHDKWIVIDLTTKRMYAYEQTNLVKTFLVSAGAPKTPTVTGEYHIYSKVAKQDMRGANADGSRYFQPDVQWINYFYADYAIHGNYWRPLSYFGNVNSSHGCVGVVNSDAAWIYQWAPVGTTVITHY